MVDEEQGPNSQDAWDGALLKDPRFIAMLERSRRQIKEVKSVTIEEIDFANP